MLGAAHRMGEEGAGQQVAYRQVAAKEEACRLVVRVLAQRVVLGVTHNWVVASTCRTTHYLAA